jgi:hypothetical protein
MRDVQHAQTVAQEAVARLEQAVGPITTVSQVSVSDAIQHLIDIAHAAWSRAACLELQSRTTRDADLALQAPAIDGKAPGGPRAGAVAAAWHQKALLRRLGEYLVEHGRRTPSEVTRKGYAKAARELRRCEGDNAFSGYQRIC